MSPRPIPRAACFATLALFLFALPQFGSAAELPRRWAVLASTDVQKSGISDLLVAELSDRSIELVEREQIQAVFKEIELSKFFGANGARNRLHAGPLLKAGGLLLLELEQPAGQSKRLRMLVSETKYGARLRAEFHAWPPKDPAALAKQLAGVVLKTQQRFPKGIERIVGVGPFLSQNLLHNFDYLQFAFSTLLGQGLSQYPGVAVLEIEEVQAIDDELKLTAGKIENRVVPVIIEAEYRMTEQAKPVAPEDAMLNISVRAGGGQTAKWVQQNVTLSAASNWLRAALPQLILKTAGQRRLSTDAQFKALATRADVFSEAGAWTEAIALRESALLLKEDLIERFRLVGDYRRGQRLIETENRNRRTRRFWKSKQTLEEQLEFFRSLDEREFARITRFVQIVEELLASRRINIVEGAQLWSLALQFTGTGHHRESQRERHALHRQVYWKGLPRLARLDGTIRNGDMHPELRRALAIQVTFWRPSSAGQSRVWTTLAMNRVPGLHGKNRFLGLPFEPKTILQDIERMLTEVSPWPMPDMVVRTLPRGFARPGGGELVRTLKVFQLTDDQIDEFFLRLTKSSDSLVLFYGRLGLLSQKLKLEKETPKSVDPHVMDELKSLRQFLRSHADRYPTTYELAAEIDGRLADAEIIVTKGWNGYIARSKRPQDSESLRLGQASVRFEPIAGITATWDQLAACGEEFDVVFRSDQLWYMRRPGELVSVFQRQQDNDHIQSAIWDGRWLWITTDRSGLRVFDADGELLGHLPPAASDTTSNQAATDRTNAAKPTLPPYRRWGYGPSHYRLIKRKAPGMPARPALRICPLGDGRCVVAAQYGVRNQTWVCLVNLDDAGQWRVDLIHEARKIPASGETAAVQDAGYAFEPSWLVPYTFPGKRPRRVVLIGRFWNNGLRSALPPLVVDPNSKQISLLNGHFEERPFRWQQMLTIGNSLVHKTHNLAETLSPNDQGVWKSRLINPSPNRDYSIRLQGPILRVGKTLLIPEHSGWARLHTDRWQLEFLKPRPLPASQRYPYQFHAVSAHYGPVVWRSDGPLMRVVIEESAEKAARGIEP